MQEFGLSDGLREEGDGCAPVRNKVFHFYILFLLGFMSGLAAGQGSRFMSLGCKGKPTAVVLP